MNADKFVKSERQRRALEVVNNNEHTLLFGGSRSGKTTVLFRNVILRALKETSRHLIVRHRFNHLKTSIWHDTMPKVLKMCFPNVIIKENKSDWFITIKNRHGEYSQVWFGGIDDKERVEKILGNEYSTIYANECSQIAYEAIITLRTRLAENTPLANKFYYDCNPPGKRHWTYQEFHEKLIPTTREPSKLQSAFSIINPMDNIVNLPDGYIRNLEALPKRERQRYLDGLFLSDIEGALWTELMVSDAKAMFVGELEETIVSVDPAVTNEEDSDEVGITVQSRDVNGHGILHEDLSGKMSTHQWARRVANAWEKWNANYVIAEVNQGGDLVVDAIKAINPLITVIKVHASKGKLARAEPVAALYEMGKIAHMGDFPALEGELTEWVPWETKYSPGRLDALVWGFTHLLIKRKRNRRAA